MTTPFVFFDNRFELTKYFISILKTIHPNQEIFVLTNAKKPKILWDSKQINFIQLDSLQYSARFKKFANVYEHLSTHSPDFELSCFERYFAIESFMSRYQVDEIWHLDTDVLPTQAIHLIKRGKMVFSSPYNDLSVVSAHTARFTFQGISSLNNFLLDEFYTKNLASLRAFYDARVRNGLTGGVCDMQGLSYWLRSRPSSEWQNSYGVLLDGTQLNHTLSGIHKEVTSVLKSSKLTANIFLFFGGGGLTLIHNSGKLKFSTIHFQGQYKFLISPFIKIRFLIGSPKFLNTATKVLVKSSIIAEKAKKLIK
jgi:hypothetical protein